MVRSFPGDRARQVPQHERAARQVDRTRSNATSAGKTRNVGWFFSQRGFSPGVFPAASVHGCGVDSDVAGWAHLRQLQPVTRRKRPGPATDCAGFFGGHAVPETGAPAGGIAPMLCGAMCRPILTLTAPTEEAGPARLRGLAGGRSARLPRWFRAQGPTIGASRQERFHCARVRQAARNPSTATPVARRTAKSE